MDAERGWAVGYKGTIVATLDGGQSWQGQSSGTAASLYSVHFVDAQRGWAVGSYGTILATLDGGQSWQEQSSGTDEGLESVHFVDAQRGWAVGKGGSIIATLDGGQSWENPLLPYRRLPAPWVYLLFIAAFVLPFLPLSERLAAREKQLEIEEQGQTDRPVEQRHEDKLGFWPVSHALSRFLRNRNTEPPLTVAITGSWGSGKSSLMNFLKTELASSGVRPIWFNAWHHESEEEHLLAALLQNIRTQGVPPFLSIDGGKFYGLRFRLSLLLNRLKMHPILLLFLLALVFLNIGYWQKTEKLAFVPEAETRAALADACSGFALPRALCKLVGGDGWQAPMDKNLKTKEVIKKKIESTGINSAEQTSTTVETKITKTTDKPSKQITGEPKEKTEINWFALLISLAGSGGVITLLSWLRAFGFSPAQLAREITGSGKRQIEQRMDYRQRFQQEFRTVTDALSPPHHVDTY